jgi:hypothetical protein
MTLEGQKPARANSFVVREYLCSQISGGCVVQKFVAASRQAEKQEMAFWRFC